MAKIINQEISHIYIHIPFCLSKCGYCSFFSLKYNDEMMKFFLTYLDQEIEFYLSNFNINAKTIYLGGGTPSLLKPDQLQKIISGIPKQNSTEITIEANPQDITGEIVQTWINCGINRVSLGLQSMIPAELIFLGRRNSVAENINASDILKKKGVANINFDLIYGLPDQTLSDVEYSINEFIKLAPRHLSTYCLSLDENCALAKEKQNLPTDDAANDMYYKIRQILLAGGWQQYEISNFCLGDNYSCHNLAYWENQYYLGCGPAAAGYLPEFRYNNPASLSEWIERVARTDFFTYQESINDDLREKEYIILALRTTKGLKLTDFAARFNTDFKIKYQEKLAKFSHLKLLEEDAGYIRLSVQGYFISNEILSEFV